MTATVDLDEINFAVSIALARSSRQPLPSSPQTFTPRHNDEPKTSCFAVFFSPLTTADKNPALNASAAEKLRAVNATSRVKLSFPIILGTRAREPMSAAMPTSTSCASNLVSARGPGLLGRKQGEDGAKTDLDGELSRLSSIPDIASRQDVHAQTECKTMHGRNNRHSAFLDRRDRRLELLIIILGVGVSGRSSQHGWLRGSGLECRVIGVTR